MAFGRKLEASTASKAAPTSPDGSETVRLLQAGAAKESAVNDLAVTPANATTGLTLAQLHGLLPVNVLTRGLENDGATDITAAAITMFEAGGWFHFPAGDYYVAGAGSDAGGVNVDWTKNIKVTCDPGARFICGALDNDLFRFIVPTDGSGLPDVETYGKLRFEWDGGYFDRHLQKNSTSIPSIGTYPPTYTGASATCTGISVNAGYDSGGGTYVNGAGLVRITNTEHYCGDHWQSAGGDDTIFISGADDYQVTGNIIQGARDNGVYISRTNGTATGMSGLVAGNTFRKCFFGVSFKRSAANFKCVGNHFDNCIVAIQTSHVTGSGFHCAVIYGNTYRNVSRAVRISYCQGVIADVGTGENMGSLLENGTAQTTYSFIALMLAGSKYCTVRGARFLSVDGAHGSAQLMEINAYDPGSGSILSEYNSVEDNVAWGFTSAGGETTAEADNNYLYRNKAISAGSPNFTVAGANSVSIRRTDAGAPIYRTPISFANGSAAAPIIARESQATTGFFFDTNKVGQAVAGTERSAVDTIGLTSNQRRLWETVGVGATGWSITGTTSETTLRTVTIPANALGPNGVVRITAVWSYTSSANNKTKRIKFGGTSYQVITSTTTTSMRHEFVIHNANSASAQKGWLNSATFTGTTSGSRTSSSVDTTSAVDIVFTAELANTGETITLEQYIVEICYGA